MYRNYSICIFNLIEQFRSDELLCYNDINRLDIRINIYETHPEKNEACWEKYSYTHIHIRYIHTCTYNNKTFTYYVYIYIHIYTYIHYRQYINKTYQILHTYIAYIIIICGCHIIHVLNQLKHVNVVIRICMRQFAYIISEVTNIGPSNRLKAWIPRTV